MERDTTDGDATTTTGPLDESGLPDYPELALYKVLADALLEVPYYEDDVEELRSAVRRFEQVAEDDPEILISAWLHGSHMSDDADHAGGDSDADERGPPDGTDADETGGEDPGGHDVDEIDGETEASANGAGRDAPEESEGPTADRGSESVAGDRAESVAEAISESMDGTDGDDGESTDDETATGTGEAGSETDGDIGVQADADLVARVAAVDERLAGDVEALAEETTALESEVSALESETDALNADLAERDDRIEELETAVEERDERIAELEEALQSREEEAADLEEEVTSLRASLESRDERVEDLESKLKRKQAEFQNYKKRRKRQEEDIRERATEDLVERLVDVRDNLLRALEDESGDAEALREGVEMTLREFDRVLDAEGVDEIAPEPGSEVDPQRHEVMVRMESEQPEDTIAEVYQPGYEMGDKIVRSARVTVSEGPPEDGGSDGAETANDDDDGSGVDGEPVDESATSGVEEAAGAGDGGADAGLGEDEETAGTGEADEEVPTIEFEEQASDEAETTDGETAENEPGGAEDDSDGSGDERGRAGDDGHDES